MHKEICYHLLEKALEKQGFNDPQIQKSYILQRILEKFHFDFENNTIEALEDFYNFCLFDLELHETSEGEELLKYGAISYDYHLIAHAGCYMALFHD